MYGRGWWVKDVFSTCDRPQTQLLRRLIESFVWAPSHYLRLLPLPTTEWWLNAFFEGKTNAFHSPHLVKYSLIFFLMPWVFHSQTSCKCWYKSENNNEELLHFPSTVLGYPSCVVRRQLKEAAGMHAELKANNAFQATKILNKTLVQFLWVLCECRINFLVGRGIIR